MDTTQIINYLTELVRYSPGSPLMMGSFGFGIIFCIFLALYVLFRKWNRGLMMIYVICFSLFFAYKANGVHMLLLPLTGIVNYGLVECMRKRSGWKSKLLLTLVILIDIGQLFFFKYAHYFQADIILPIGISFYSFQAVSYAIDVYRGSYCDKTSIIEYLFYLTFFPLLLAGPITRANNLLPALKKNEQASSEMVWKGLFLIILGLIKKNVLSDYIAQYNNWVFDAPSTFSGFECLSAAIGFSVQIYLDFSGYSDMSIGVASIMGFSLPDNFCFPYRALNPTDFWRRWHISLSTWFRDYLYIPLGGNRKGAFRTYVNCFIVMLVAGIWHGSTIMFVIWGALHGVGLMVHKLFVNLAHFKFPSWCHPFFWIANFMFITVAWTFFRADNMNLLSQLYHQMFSDFSLAFLLPFAKARTMWCIFVIGTMLLLLIPENGYKYTMEKFIRLPWIIKLLIFVGCLLIVAETSLSSVQPFIYFNF